MSMSNRDLQIVEHILRYCEKIEKTCERFGVSFDVFAADSDFVDSISMNLLQIGELAGKLSDDFVAETKDTVDWRAIKNMRNMFAHDYGSMDIDRIWETAIDDIPELEASCSDFLKQDQEQTPTMKMF